MTDKELDNLVKQKLNHQTFEFDEKYWQQAEVLIDAQLVENKTLIYYKLGFYASVLALFALLGWFLVENNTANKNGNILANSSPITNELVYESNMNNTTKTNKLNLESNKLKDLKSAKNEIMVNHKELVLNNNLENNNLNNSNNLSKSKNSNNDIIESIDNQIVINNDENELLLENKPTQLLSLQIEEPSFSFTKIDFLKKPIPTAKSQNVFSTFNASIETGVNSFNTAFGSNSIGYYVGGRLYLDFGKLSINSNLHFENINQNLAARNIVNKTYDFTSNTEIVSIKNNSLDYAIIGLNAMYPIYKNHSLGIGIQYAYLVQSKDLITTQNLELNTINSKKAENYNSNINKTDLQFTLNYQFRFAKHLAVGATYVYGLNEVSKTSTSTYNNQGVKLGLQYIIK